MCLCLGVALVFAEVLILKCFGVHGHSVSALSPPECSKQEEKVVALNEHVARNSNPDGLYEHPSMEALGPKYYA